MKNLSTTKYSVLMGFALIAYFLIINSFGLATQSYLSFFNAIIVGIGIFLVIRDIHRNKDEFEYFEGFVAGIKSGFVATLIFTVFMAIYLFEIDLELAQELKKQISTAGTDIEFALLIFILLSGFATSVVTPLLILPIYEKSWNTKETRGKQKPLDL
ncbi:DUF4199 domain-containing protein [Nonlabens sp.]|uniref:DUF4199 domain-containing protein n=1 Tax=Nonlabens sp. TaxID=1888209 RepID=UPI00262976BC|nr:DUF4199 domain-containing protein [Nonlabens sp.]